jgi:hypothetical protein
MAKRKFFTKKVIGFIVVVIIAFIYVYSTKEPGKEVAQTVPQEQTAKKEPITITKKDIKEENFTGSSITITGENTLAKTAREYVNTSISDFRARANVEVPDLKKQFGPDVSAAEYSIDFDGTYLESEKTESLVISSYAYTGGANGMSTYKVFTASKADGHIIPVTEAVKKDSQAVFVKAVQDALIAWRPEGMEETPVFKDEVAKLTIADMANWSLDDKNLTVYFDKYAVGPGALGPVAMPIPYAKVRSFLSI